MDAITGSHYTCTAIVVTKQSSFCTFQILLTYYRMASTSKSDGVRREKTDGGFQQRSTASETYSRVLSFGGVRPEREVVPFITNGSGRAPRIAEEVR